MVQRCISKVRHTRAFTYINICMWHRWIWKHTRPQAGMMPRMKGRDRNSPPSSSPSPSFPVVLTPARSQPTWVWKNVACRGQAQVDQRRDRARHKKLRTSRVHPFCYSAFIPTLLLTLNSLKPLLLLLNTKTQCKCLTSSFCPGIHFKRHPSWIHTLPAAWHSYWRNHQMTTHTYEGPLSENLGDLDNWPFRWPHFSLSMHSFPLLCFKLAKGEWAHGTLDTLPLDPYKGRSPDPHPSLLTLPCGPPGLE